MYLKYLKDYIYWWAKCFLGNYCSDNVFTHVILENGNVMGKSTFVPHLDLDAEKAFDRVPCSIHLNEIILVCDKWKQDNKIWGGGSCPQYEKLQEKLGVNNEILQETKPLFMKNQWGLLNTKISTIGMKML